MRFNWADVRMFSLITDSSLILLNMQMGSTLNIGLNAVTGGYAR